MFSPVVGIVAVSVLARHDRLVVEVWGFGVLLPQYSQSEFLRLVPGKCVLPWRGDMLPPGHVAVPAARRDCQGATVPSEVIKRKSTGCKYHPPDRDSLPIVGVFKQGSLTLPGIVMLLKASPAGHCIL